MLALMGAIVVGPRIGKFVGANKQSRSFFGHSIPLPVIGAWLLVFGPAATSRAHVLTSMIGLLSGAVAICSGAAVMSPIFAFITGAVAGVSMQVRACFGSSTHAR